MTEHLSLSVVFVLGVIFVIVDYIFVVIVNADRSSKEWVLKTRPPISPQLRVTPTSPQPS